MSATQQSALDTRPVNRLAVVSVIAAVLAVAGMFGLGIGAASAFAVGAGHVSLYQIRRSGDRGRTVALAGLIFGYAVAVWSFALGLRYIPTIITEFF